MTSEQKQEKTIVLTAKKPGGPGAALDKIFHFTDRGTTMKSEIGAGISSFFIAVCALLMNTQIIGGAYGNYAGSYLAAALLAFAGTLLLGIVCNLPLVQTANMGLSTVLITMLGANTGLTYANLMAVTFVAAVIYLVIVLTPARKIFLDALPEGVKKALPVGVGFYVMITALKNAGILNAEGGVTSASSLNKLNTYYFWLMSGAVFFFILMKALKRRKPALVTFVILVGAMWIGGVLFYLDYFVGGQTAATVVYERVNLVVATDGASPYNIVTGFRSLNLGTLFTQGFDFSGLTAAGGSVPLIFFKGILTFLSLGLYTNLGNLKATAVAGDYDGEDYAAAGEQKALVLGAVLNTAAPVLGVPPTSVGVQSAVGVNDRGKTGLSSMAAAAGFLIALFSWIFFMFFATTTNGVGMWINDTEIKLAAYVQDGFAFADLIMALAGASMLKGISRVDVKKLEEMIPFAAALAGIAILGDVALGVALGCISWVICKLAGRRWKEMNVSIIILSVVMLLYLITALM